MKAITTCNASLVAGTLAGDAQASWKDLRGSVAVFSSLVCLLWERPLNTVYKCQRALSYRAIF